MSAPLAESQALWQYFLVTLPNLLWRLFRSDINVEKEWQNNELNSQNIIIVLKINQDLATFFCGIWYNYLNI